MEKDELEGYVERSQSLLKVSPQIDEQNTTHRTAVGTSWMGETL